MRPTTTIEVSGSRRTIRLTATIDTGFDGFVCIPVKKAVKLGLELRGTSIMELADGSLKEEMYFLGSVRFRGRTRQLKILATDSDEALIGTGLLDDCRLTIDFAAGTVAITKSRKQKRRKG